MHKWRKRLWFVTGGPLLCLTAALAYASLPVQDGLELQFIGNMAFRISDGQVTLLTDFPYRSGQSGYDTYRLEDVGPILNGVSLITHDHLDHWDPALFRKMNLKVIAPPEITKGLPVDRVVTWGDRIVFGPLEVHPIATPHTPTHHSYLVMWHGLRMFFTGDTEDPQVVAAQLHLDALFASPWLIREFAKTSQKLDTELLVVYHHRAGEDVPMLPRMLLPHQGDVFHIEFKD
jgi:hypothetical protein